MKEALAEALKENQSYHNYLQENYGPSHEFYLQHMKAEYLARLSDRVRREKWATVEELVTVNQKLRERLKLI